MSIEKGLAGQGEKAIEGQEEIMVDMHKLVEKVQKNLEFERSFSEADETGELGRNFLVIQNIVDNYLESIREGGLSLEELKSKRQALANQIMSLKKEIMASIKDGKLQRELIARAHNSYEFLTYKAIGYITE